MKSSSFDFLFLRVEKQKRINQTSRSFLYLAWNGRLRLDTGIYKGHHAYIKVPNTGKMAKSVEYSQLAAEHGQRDYEVMIANCNLSGRKIRIQGQVLFDFSKDQHPKTNTLTPFPGHPLVSISVFLFFTVCFVRIRFTTRAAYEELRSHSTARMGAVEMIETAWKGRRGRLSCVYSKLRPRCELEIIQLPIAAEKTELGFGTS